MKILLILMTSVSAGVASGDHFHSFLLGLGIATLAVGCCHWFAFRSSKFPELALFLLICGLLAKVTITVIGIMWGISRDLITSPLVFALSYLFFSVVATYVWFRYQEYLSAVKQKVRKRLA